MARPISIAVRGIHCFNEQESSDEPYVITSVVDLRNKVIIPGAKTIFIPAVDTTKTGPWSDIDSGDTVKTRSLLPGTTVTNFSTSMSGVLEALGHVMRKPVWGFNWQPQLVQNPDDLIILCALMEHDNSSPDSVRSIADGTVVGAAYGLANAGLDRATFVTKLKESFKDGLKTGMQTGFINSDEKIGGIWEVRLTPDDIKKLDTPNHINIDKTQEFHGAFDSEDHNLDPGVKYNVTYQIRNYSFIPTS